MNIKIVDIEKVVYGDLLQYQFHSSTTADIVIVPIYIITIILMFVIITLSSIFHISRPSLFVSFFFDRYYRGNTGSFIFSLSNTSKD